MSGRTFETDTDFSDWLARQAASVFPMYNQALYQFTLFQKENAVGYVIRLHHIIADGWSFQMLTEEIHESYLSLAGGDIFADTSAISYKQFIRTENEYLQSKRYERDRRFWNARLGGSPEPFLQLPQADISGARYTCRLNSRQKREIFRVCQENNVSRGAFFYRVVSAVSVHFYR
ncbi:MAG: condensation domain-containing protein [Clostridia bacterium]